MSLLQFSILIAGILNFFLGVIVLKRNFRLKVNLTFGVFALLTSLWVLTNFFLIMFPTITILRLAYSFGVLVISASLSWVLVLCETRKKILVAIPYILGGLFFILGNTPLVIEGIISFSETGSIISYGPLFYIYAAYMVLSLASLLIKLLVTANRSTGYRKSQLRFVFLGGLIFGLFSIVGSFILPLFDIEKFIMWDSPSSLFFIGFSTYAIVKHRLMDIRMVVARSVTYVALLVILGGFYAGAIFAAQSFIFREASPSIGYLTLQIILAVIMAFSFQPLRKWITIATDKVFFKNQYNTEQLLDTLAHTIGSTIVLIELIYKTLDLLITEMKITRGIFVTLNEAGGVYNSQYSGYKERPKIESEDIAKIIKDGILIYDDLPEKSHYKTLLRKYSASAVIPLRTENATEGVLILGEKMSGDMYSSVDLKVFEIIAPEIAVAITNAKAFEKIEKFNVTLRQEVKKATSELEQKNEQLRELDKAKDEFISMASHQLRTPLTAIKGYLSMLLEGDAGEIKVSQYDFVNEAFQGANRMVGLINDLLNVSRMETGRFFLEPVEVDMKRMVEEEMKQLENHARDKKLKFIPKLDSNIPHVWVDETKIRQVVMNFIDNAIYYTTDGSVTVSLTSDKKDVVFKVVDTGIGVPKEAQKNLFTKFYRADNARHVRPDGTGLGIYLAKRVMDDHGGEIIFHSEEGKGSTFGFKLPIKSNLKVKKATAPSPSGTTPPVGEIAAGVGVPAEALQATSEAGIEKPLPDSADAKDLEKEAKDIKTVKKP